MVTTNNRNEEEPDFSDPEDYVDNISNEELLPELMAKKPRLDKSIDKILVIDNIPKVGQEKRNKFRNVLTKLLEIYGAIVNEYYPEENGVFKGYMFVEYDNEQSALDAKAQLDDYVLDKNHVFKINLLSDFDTYQRLNLENEVETPLPYKEPGNLMWWLTQNDCYDQFAILFSDMHTSVYLNTPTQPTLLESREKWTSTRFQWSPKGTYLATFHERGIALWAGEQFKQFMRFSHQGVQLIDFSPCEKYLVTCNPNLAGVDDQALIIWCTRTGQEQRSFSCERSHNISWPFFKWNYDDTYFARLANDALLVYETNTFTLLNKKAIKIKGISDFEWSPTNNYISYWIAEDRNVLARVVVMEIPSTTELRSKNLVNVSDCKMYWQNNGDYVCVRVDRYKKLNVVKEDDKENIRYSGIYYNFEIFRIREKQIPVDSIEIKETFQSFAWEPYGQKFCMVYGDQQSKVTAAFYRIVNATTMSAGKLELIKEVKSRNLTQIYWAPQGQYCVLASTASKTQGQTCFAEFYDVTTNDAQLINKMEQDLMTDIEWDPTGRYLVSYVSYWNCKSENSYIIWNFQGKQLQKMNFDKLYKFSWRPRPQGVLTDEQKKEIRKNLRQYSDKYNLIDRQYLTKVSKEILEKRRHLMSEFNSFKKSVEKKLAEQRQKRLELRKGYELDKSMDEEIEYTVQFLVDSKKEEVSID